MESTQSTQTIIQIQYTSLCLNYRVIFFIFYLLLILFYFRNSLNFNLIFFLKFTSFYFDKIILIKSKKKDKIENRKKYFNILAKIIKIESSYQYNTSLLNEIIQLNLTCFVKISYCQLICSEYQFYCEFHCKYLCYLNSFVFLLFLDSSKNLHLSSLMHYLSIGMEIFMIFEEVEIKAL